MPMHDYFEELCALAAIGQLSPEEHWELVDHLRGCDACKRLSDDFALILDQLPAADPPEISGDTEDLLSQSYRTRFLAKAVADGIRFSAEASGSPRRLGWRLIPNWRLSLAVAAAVACLVAGIAIGNQFMVHHPPASAKAQEKGIYTPVPTPIQHVSTAAEPHELVAKPEADEQLAVLKRQLAQLIVDRDRARAESERLQVRLQQSVGESESSSRALAQANAALIRLQDENTRLAADLTQQIEDTRQLSSRLQEQTAAADRERQLAAVASDVRELMSARNLHMIDVYDFDTRGRRDKSFGRVFYTEGKSLIFYAFDLSQKADASKVTFQAWGQREAGGSATVKSLGTFYIEDHAQKRWVLRVNDPQLLSSIDSVFVTVEPVRGSDKPSGKKLLYAYLGTQANHP